MNDIEQITPPVEPLLTLGQAKAQLNVLHTAEDQRIEMFVEAAEDQIRRIDFASLNWPHLMV